MIAHRWTRIVAVFLCLCLTAETVPAHAFSTSLITPITKAIFCDQTLAAPVAAMNGRTRQRESRLVFAILVKGQMHDAFKADREFVGSIFDAIARLFRANHPTSYWLYTVIGAAWWETKIFQQYGWANGAPGLLWATLGFAFAHTFVEWLFRTSYSRETLKQDLMDFLTRLSLSIGFIVPYVFHLPHAFLWSAFFHAAYNAFAFWRGRTLASIFRGDWMVSLFAVFGWKDVVSRTVYVLGDRVTILSLHRLEFYGPSPVRRAA